MAIAESVPVSTPKSLQIGLYSEGFAGIKAGLRTFPVSKIVLIYESRIPPKHGEQETGAVRDFLRELRGALDIDAEARPISSSSLEVVLEAMREIKLAHRSYDDIFVNLSEGSKMLSCSALSSAFILGIRAFTFENGKPYTFPVLKLGYYHAISEAKLGILKAIQKKSDTVNSLEELANMTGYERAEVSRHVNGSSDSKGLVELGLITVERRSHGRLAVSLSPLGKILLMGSE